MRPRNQWGCDLAPETIWLFTYVRPGTRAVVVERARTLFSPPTGKVLMLRRLLLLAILAAPEGEPRRGMYFPGSRWLDEERDYFRVLNTRFRGEKHLRRSRFRLHSVPGRCCSH